MAPTSVLRVDAERGGSASHGSLAWRKARRRAREGEPALACAPTPVGRGAAAAESAHFCAEAAPPRPRLLLEITFWRGTAEGSARGGWKLRVAEGAGEWDASLASRVRPFSPYPQFCSAVILAHLFPRRYSSYSAPLTLDAQAVTITLLRLVNVFWGLQSKVVIVLDFLLQVALYPSG